MKKINLRELYPNVYTTAFFVDVTEEVMETIRAAERAEAAYERKMYRYKAQYSLDCENGIENAVLLKPQTPEMLLEEKQFQEQVYAAVMKLPEKQANQVSKQLVEHHSSQNDNLNRIQKTIKTSESLDFPGFCCSQTSNKSLT